MENISARGGTRTRAHGTAWRDVFGHLVDVRPWGPRDRLTVRIINLSLGDTKRRFAGVMSPWARMIDYLAWSYNVLILVSAGNITDRLPLDGVKQWAHFERADVSERQLTLLRAILRRRADRRLLAPAEAVNALTVGAAHDDHLAPNGQGVMAIDPYAGPTLPNPSSALGLGFRRAIKPEILFPGGAEQIRANSTHAPIEVGPVTLPAKFFGIGVASPGVAGQTNRRLNMSGTSVATALATHNAMRILEALEELPDDPAHLAGLDLGTILTFSLPEHRRVRLKAMQSQVNCDIFQGLHGSARHPPGEYLPVQNHLCFGQGTLIPSVA